MSDWTPTPWIARGLGGDSIVLAEDHKWHREYPTREGLCPISVPRHYKDRDGFGRTDISGGFSHADAQRIVAAVNFFHGSDIPTAMIKQGGFGEILEFVLMVQDTASRPHIPKAARALLASLGGEP